MIKRWVIWRTKENTIGSMSSYHKPDLDHYSRVATREGRTVLAVISHIENNVINAKIIELLNAIVEDCKNSEF